MPPTGQPAPAVRPWVLHVDLDQFLVAVELLRRPDLVGLPVVVGGRGDPTERAVVATASYEARAFGVRSGVPLKVAVRRCPQAVFLPSDHAHYERASRAVMAVLTQFPGTVVKQIGWDEAFVGLTTDDPQARAHELRQAVLAATGLSCSIGIGDSLVTAKTATGFGKPAGVFTLTRATWFDVMGDRPVTDLWGIGPRIGKRLADLGVSTVRELAATPRDRLIEAFGPAGGGHLHHLGHGAGRRTPDDTPRIAQAHGHEVTFQQDLTTREQVRDALTDLSEQVLADLRAEGRRATRVHLKARFKPFFTTTKVRKLPEPTWDPAVVAATALALFDKLQDDRPVRLLGVRAEMEPPPAPAAQTG